VPPWLTHRQTQLSTGYSISSAGSANKNVAMLLPINTVLTKIKHYKHVNEQKTYCRLWKKNTCKL